jgi:hypothetical protein
VKERDRARRGAPLLGCAYFVLIVMVVVIIVALYILWALFIQTS